MTKLPTSTSAADLSHCAQEAIHKLGIIQSYGVLLVCDLASGKLLQHSANAAQCLGIHPSLFVQQTLPHLLGVSDEQWQNWCAQASTDAAVLVATLSQEPSRPALEVLLHRVVLTATTQIVCELIPTGEPFADGRHDVVILGELARQIRQLHGFESVDDFATGTVQAMQVFLGYDRVMLYRFEADWSGLILAEATASGVEQHFMGLRFPASDIPAQARDLYTRNLLRIIADVQAPPSAMLSLPHAADAVLDQSHCLLRQPSSMHLTYLGNMGVRATLIISLMYQGKLWGMLACHHHQPRMPPDHHRHTARIACELIADSLASKLEELLHRQALEHQHNVDVVLVQLREDLRAITSTELSWTKSVAALTELLGPCQIMGRLNGENQGQALLSEPALKDLLLRLQATQPGQALATDHVTAWGWSAQDFLSREPMAGLLAVSPAGDADTYIVVLREPWVHSVLWGGQPDQHEPQTLPDGQVVWGPRRSFASWQQDIKDHSQPWLAHEMSALAQTTILVKRVHTQALLSASRERLQLLGASMDLLQDFVLMTEAEPRPGETFRRIVYANPALCEQSGYSAKELLGRSPSLFQGLNTDKALIETMTKQLKAWQPVHETLLNYKKDGTPYWIDMKIMPIANASGWYTHWISVQRNITATVELQARLQSEKDRLDNVMSATGAGTWVLDCLTGIYQMDAQSAAFFGLSPHEAESVDVPRLRARVHPQDLAEVIRSSEAHLRGEAAFHDARFRIQDARGQWIWLRVRGRVIARDANGTALQMIGTYTDVTEYVQTAHAAEQYRLDLESTVAALPDALLTFDDTGRILLARAPGDLLFGKPVAELKNSNLFELLEPAACATLKNAMNLALNGDAVNSIEFCICIAAVQHHFECAMAHKKSVDSESASVSYVLTVRDVSQRKADEAKIEQLIYFDPLTGLHNRRALFDKLAQVHRRCQQQSQTYAVLFIDLDHFKDLNDTRGHQAGDALLRLVAQRLQAELGGEDILSRVGSDEFVVVISNLVAGPDAALLAYNLAERLRQALAKPFAMEGMAYQLTCSVGVAMGDAAEQDVNEVIKRADIATLQAKTTGRNKSQFFDQTIQQALQEQTALEQDLRQAVNNNELRLYYQPIVNRAHEVVGHEALVRWQHPTRGLVPPVAFIPVAEQSDLILAIGQWVLQTACEQLAAWACDPVRSQWVLAVNVSATQIQQADFVQGVQQTLARTQAAPDRLKLELTESLLNADLDATILKMQQLRAIGIRFALDDFGTGYSSMSYIKRLPLNQLKIDRSFVMDLPDDQDAGAIATMIIQMASTLHMEVVAEGVETQAQAQYLENLGCQFFQGYLFGKPVPLQD